MDLSNLSIKEIKVKLDEMEEVADELVESLALDSRKGVQRLAQQLIRQQRKEEELRAKYEKMSVHERRVKQKGYRIIGGIDEAGRGPLAGPVVAAIVILPEDEQILGLDDSKKLSEKKREELFGIIQEKAIDIGVGIVDNNRIDEINILQATYQAMREAINSLEHRPEYLLVDAETIPDITIAQAGIIEGDAHSVSIAAASIVAKVTRDRMLVEYDKEYPQYKFASNKGYGTGEHIQALKRYGITPLHRTSFGIVRESMNG
ncbi:RNase HII [Orenia metallireducens]|jgi:ribonuclease HII|uniref:Ribonuclease HII n=1 Tax=Orenia metallireducens TaxID=1413210 RepID=A0A285HJG4_9FIRM|nr:ribonuclease HII [Orenia metallireducens]PRX26653.1 RNase HII [Orenia metallireducens]SNY35868.1 RNase HII [Orenia metallireducens]